MDGLVALLQPMSCLAVLMGGILPEPVLSVPNLAVMTRAGPFSDPPGYWPKLEPMEYSEPLPSSDHNVAEGICLIKLEDQSPRRQLGRPKKCQQQYGQQGRRPPTP